MDEQRRFEHQPSEFLTIKVFGVEIPLGPAIILLAFGQATGELVHWPYLMARYGTHFLFLLLPACVMQFPIFIYLARHTMLSGESFFTLLTRSNRGFAILTWLVFFLTTIWISSYSASGGVSLVALMNRNFGTSIPLGLGGSLVAIILNTFFFAILLTRKQRSFGLIKWFMRAIAALSLLVITALFFWTIIVRGLNGEVFKGLFTIHLDKPFGWSPTDWKLIITAVIFAGLGGLWNVLYSVWVREHKLGTSTSGVLEAHRDLPMVNQGEESKKAYKRSMSFITRDLIVGVVVNSLMLFMLAYITIEFYPKDIEASRSFGIITTLADAVSFEYSGLSIVFYLFIFLFLVDTWMAAVDALSKVHANFFVSMQYRMGFNMTRETALQRAGMYYFVLLCFMWVMTIVSALIAAPQELNYLNGIMSGLGTVMLIVGIYLNERTIHQHFSGFRIATGWKLWLALALIFYSLLGGAYLIQL